MQSRWYGLDPTGLPRGVILIDATLSAEPLWHGPISSILEEFRDRLPTERHPEVVFLGGHEPQTLDRVLDGLLTPSGPLPSLDLQKEFDRYPVIGPYLRNWIRSASQPVVLLTNSQVPDIEDWAIPEVIAALVITRLTGPQRLSPPIFRESGLDSDLDSLVEHLHDSISEIRVGGNQAFVLDWQPQICSWENGELRAPGEHIKELLVLVTHPDDHTPYCELRRRSGSAIKVPLVAAGDVPSPTDAVTAPDAESVMRRWRAGHSSGCPYCPAQHSPGKLWCERNGEGAILRSLAKFPRGTAWMLKQNRGWTAMATPRGIVLHDDVILAARNGEWIAYQLQNNRWLPTAAPQVLIQLDENKFLLPG